MACTLQIDLRHPTQEEPEVGANENIAMTVPRIFLADDQEEMLQVVGEVLEGEFQVVGTAKDGRSVLELVPCLSPDVLVLDISMPFVNGIEVASRLRDEGSSTRIVFLTVHEDLAFIEAAMSAGASGFVLKSCLVTDLVPAIWKALEGNTSFSPSNR